MELRLLHYFLTTAQEENITRAAELLHITQPSLSRQLIHLEEELGVTLFLRGKRKLTLTDDGMLLRQRAEEIVSLVQKTEREFSEHNELCNGTVSIGCTETMAASVLPDLIDHFHKQFPHIKYEFYCGNSDEVKEHLDKGMIDFGIIREPINAEKYEYIQIPHTDRWGILFSSHNPLSHKKEVTPEEVSSLPLLLPSRQTLLDEITGWFNEENAKLSVLATYNTLSTAIILTQNGFGNAICPESALRMADNRLVNFRPLVPIHATSSFLVLKKQKIHTSATSRFLQFIKNAYNV